MEFCTKWEPLKFLYRNEDSEVSSYCVLVLNQSIKDEDLFISYLWNHGSLRVAVDGGGNIWNTMYRKNSSLRLPNIVSGDFDSIDPQILNFFRNQCTVKIVETPDQNFTDFTKAMNICAEDFKQQSINHVFAICELEGRFDQAMGNIETLFHVWKSINPSPQVYLVGSENITWLLTPGHHIISVKQTNSKKVCKYCSLIPIGNHCVVTSHGLKWELNETKLSFGVLVSTSNEPVQDLVEIFVHENPVVWSMVLE